MKKFLFLAISLITIFLVHNTAFAEKNSDITLVEQSSLTQEESPDSISSAYQPQYKPAFLKMFFILFALLALVFLTFWIFKKFTHIRLHQGNLTKSIKILEKRAISPKSFLYLIEIE